MKVSLGSATKEGLWLVSRLSEGNTIWTLFKQQVKKHSFWSITVYTMTFPLQSLNGIVVSPTLPPALWHMWPHKVMFKTSAFYACCRMAFLELKTTKKVRRKKQQNVWWNAIFGCVPMAAWLARPEKLCIKEKFLQVNI